MATARRPVKKAAAKKAVAKKAASKKVSIEDAPAPPPPPPTVDGQAILDIYIKAAEENRWCDDGSISVSNALKKLGIEVPKPDSSGMLMRVYLEVTPGSASTDTSAYYGDSHLRSQSFANEIARELNKLLAEKFGEGKVIKMEIPVGTAGNKGTVTITPRIWAVDQAMHSKRNVTKGT